MIDNIILGHIKFLEISYISELHIAMTYITCIYDLRRLNMTFYLKMLHMKFNMLNKPK